MTPLSSVVQQIANGELKALAVAGAQRAGIAPEIPTMAEAGLPGYDLDLWFGLLAPAGTPPATVGKLAHIADIALKTDDIGGAMRRVGIDPVGGSPGGFCALYRCRSEKGDRSRCRRKSEEVTRFYQCVSGCASARARNR